MTGEGLGLLVILFFFGLAGGIVGKIKGSSFFIWFLVSFCVPFIGLLTALLYRWDKRGAAPPVPPLRQGGQAARRGLHPLRGGARVSRRGDRLRGFCAPPRRGARTAARLSRRARAGAPRPPGSPARQRGNRRLDLKIRVTRYARAAWLYPDPPTKRGNSDACSRRPDGMPQGRGRGRRIRTSRRRQPPDLRRLLRRRDPPHPGPPRGRRRSRRRGLRQGDRQGRRVAGHQRPGGHQPGHPDLRRDDGLRARSCS